MSACSSLFLFNIGYLSFSSRSRNRIVNICEIAYTITVAYFIIYTLSKIILRKRFGKSTTRNRDNPLCNL